MQVEKEGVVLQTAMWPMRTTSSMRGSARSNSALRPTPTVVGTWFGKQSADQHPVIGLPAVGRQRTSLLFGQKPEQSHRRDAHVQVEVDLLLASGLGVRDAGVLLGVPDQKFELVAQPVLLGDLIGWLFGVG